MRVTAQHRNAFGNAKFNFLEIRLQLVENLQRLSCMQFRLKQTYWNFPHHLHGSPVPVQSPINGKQ